MILKIVFIKIKIKNDELNYMIIDLVYAPKRNKVKIIDVEIIIDDNNEIIESENNNNNNDKTNINNNKNIKILNITDENSENVEENELITNCRLYSNWNELINIDDKVNDEIEYKVLSKFSKHNSFGF